MNDAFVGLLSVLFVLGGVLCCYEYTFYTPEQRATVPGLSYAYLGVSVLLILAGLAGLVSVAVGSDLGWTVSSVAAIIAALPALVQHRMHRKLEIERSPLTDHVVEKWL